MVEDDVDGRGGRAAENEERLGSVAADDVIHPKRGRSASSREAGVPAGGRSVGLEATW